MKSSNLRGCSLLLVVALSLSAGTWAADAANHDEHHSDAVAVNHGVGIVKAIDTAAGKITLAHEPIEALKWPAMTMLFKLAPAAVIGDVAAGDQVKFDFSGTDMNDLTVVKIEKAK